MSRLVQSFGLFILAGLCEIGGGYLVWQWWRNGASQWDRIFWVWLARLFLTGTGVSERRLRDATRREPGEGRRAGEAGRRRARAGLRRDPRRDHLPAVSPALLTAVRRLR